ncbi:glycosyltransferase family 4 protein [Xenorhabdus szentirmaii]|uniref:Lipopolysaccharide core biosynthesis protein RfaG (Glucosyltransferase I) n=2 Tax=Xenorhabdus szentirmaii TaxID=290112 RepID=W1J3N7_9GAMM|nr:MULTISPECIES: glycosyltransferase family 4 protein [Xenorhabdus]MBD2792810.1 glycosyltransferase family 4 protein [Xenorhabdus sp. CUL]MBD2800362.1 glycosyltransferase family 4 protein [Xenorhabdus sp. M]MBD2820319.1 glycosyltransferase family 4 protein [Xenorhabdus sp. 42]MBD2824397.1 glycosyltransferase family 4 protein [Xenorhabdus sp. 5]PHM34369.1 WabG [Xenorhabdus szentirmaii DSM 16338]
MKPLRLAIVRQKYRPDGGAERFISRALEALESEQLELNVITRSWQGTNNPNWHIHLCNPFKFGRISRESGFAKSAQKIWKKEQFDLVQSHERIAGCDIYRAGDGVHKSWLHQRTRILPKWKAKWLLNDRYHRYVMDAEAEMYADPALKKVICNAEMVKKEIIDEFGLAEDKIAVIYNAIDSTKFFPADEQSRLQLRQQYQIPATAKCLVYVGSGFERKGLSAAIQAIAKTDSYLLVIGKDKEQKKYQEIANALGCIHRIRFMGLQKNTLPFYQLSDGLLLPTLYDPFPNVVLEAMACGLPVITSTTCGGAEFITEGKNGFVCDALDISTIRDAVQGIPNNVFGTDMSVAARNQIMAATPTHLSKQLIELYQRVLA